MKIIRINTKYYGSVHHCSLKHDLAPPHVRHEREGDMRKWSSLPRQRARGTVFLHILSLPHNKFQGRSLTGPRQALESNTATAQSNNPIVLFLARLQDQTPLVSALPTERGLSPRATQRRHLTHLHDYFGSRSSEKKIMLSSSVVCDVRGRSRDNE